MYTRIMLFLFGITFSGANIHAQIVSANIDELMKPSTDFKINMLIERFYQLQSKSVAQGDLSEFQARCIAAGSVNIIRDDTSDFLEISEHAQRGYSLSELAQEKIERIINKHAHMLQLITASCIDYDKRKLDKSPDKDSNTNSDINSDINSNQDIIP
ncbi:hypothetical protein AwWohl_13700 [Gammaproteobacteria bacterium]|nr:hypothetical protein AwWohl_13700 [Gammaproteobacteria bacterium]